MSYLDDLLASCVSVTNYHKLGGLKEQKFIVWVQEISYQGVGRVMLFLKTLKEYLF